MFINSTIDGDALYLKFRSILVNAFLNQGDDNHLSFGDVVLSVRVNTSLLFNLNYGSSFLKGCLISSWNNSIHRPDAFGFVERNTPESV